MSTRMMSRAPETKAPVELPKVRRSPFFDFERSMADLWNRFAGDGYAMGMWQTQPAMDLVEKDDAFVITADLPGMKMEDIDIQVAGNSVTVSGERNEEKEENGAAYHRVERRYGRFSRTMSLPCAVVPDECDARYTDGVLMVTLPKCEDNRAQRIQIRK